MRLPQSNSSDSGVDTGSAFTLLELLVVVALIALLAGLALPAIKGMRGGSEMAAANRQLLDDLGFARQKAIAERTTVYVLFVPTNFWTITWPTVDISKQYTNLVADQMTGYALFTPRGAGDQPGQPLHRYITEWKSLPDKVFFPDWKFTNGATVNFPNGVSIFVDPFPYLNSNAVESIAPFAVEQSTVFTRLPYVAFNSQGRVVVRVGLTEREVNTDVLIPLARGSIFDPPRDAAGNFLFTTVDFKEIPLGNSTNNPNLIRINHITGRAKIERPELR